jgi:hypothetical protein
MERKGLLMVTKLAVMSLVAAFFFSVVSPVLADGQKVETENYQIPAADPGIQLFIRNKHPEGLTNFPGEKILLFVHGFRD